MRFVLLFAFVFLLVIDGNAQTIQTNRAQRSTVRVFAVRGVDVVQIPSKTSRERRPFGVPRAGHGSGLLVTNDGLVITAKHVVEGATLLAIRAPGHERAYSARVIYEHPTLDFAFVVSAGLFADHISLPDRSPSMAMGDAAVAIGYPLDSGEELPTQMSGSVAGLTRDRHYKLSMALNPGNSGGPVFTNTDELFGIAIKTTDPRRGAQGLSIAVPMEPILEAFSQVKKTYKSQRDKFEDNSIADLAAELVMAGADGLFDEVTKLAVGPTRTKIYNAIEQASDQTDHPDVQALLAAYFFDLAGALLEHNGVYDVGDMPAGKARNDASKAIKLSVSLAKKAVKADPSVKKRSPFISVLLRAAKAPSGGPAPSYSYGPSDYFGKPKYLPYTDGDPVPDGYVKDTRVRAGLVIGGAVLFAVTYGMTAASGGILSSAEEASIVGEEPDTEQFVPLYIPVAGPFIAIDSMEAEGAGVALLIVDGVAQTAGLAMFIAGLAAQEDVLKRTSALDLRFTPVVMPNQQYGIGLSGRF